MKIRKSILLGSLVTALFICATVVLTQRLRPLESAVNAPALDEAAAQLPSPSATVPVARSVRTASAIRDRAVEDLPEIAPHPANVLRVSAGQALENVNGRTIQLKDLIPLEAEETEKQMTPEEYESRLNRAVEMELTFQAATALGVGLTAEQAKHLDGIARKHEATFQEYQKQGITWSSLTASQLEFEKRLTSALMLQQNLVARGADVKPSPDPVIQARYEDALRGLLVRLKSDANMTTLKPTI